MFLALLDAVARTKPEYAKVARLTGMLLAAAGFAIVGYAISSALSDANHLWAVTSLKLLLIAPVLSICFVPYLYFAALYLVRDRLYCLLLPALDARSDEARYARRRIRSFSGLNLRKASRLLVEKRRDLMLIRSRSDVDKLFGIDCK